MERSGPLARLETIFGVVGGLYGIAGAVFAPRLLRSTGYGCGPPYTTCGVDSATVTLLILFGVCSLGVLFGALAHGRWKHAGALGVLLLCTGVLAMGTLLGDFTIGLTPAMLAAGVSSLCALVDLLNIHLPMRRVVELVLGAASGVIGSAALFSLFFYSSILYTAGPNFWLSTSIADFYGLGRVLPALLPFGLVAVLAAAGASANALSGSRTGQALLVGATVALGAAALAAWFVGDTTFYLHSVGIGLLPSFALALVAVVLAFTGRSERAPAVAA
jgi:hypothetical protein